MKALILAGGYATRLWPITKKRAKPLLPLGGKPILDYILDELEEIDTVDYIYVTTNERFKESFEDYLSERQREKYELIIESQDKEEEKFGAVGGIINVIEKREPDDYLVIGGDNYYSFKIRDFLDFALEKDSVANVCYRVPSMEEAKNYGIVDFDEDDKILEFQEKPESPSSRMASTACYYFPEEKLKLFDEYVEYYEGRVPKDQYLDEPGRFFEWTVDKYDVYAFSFEGKWVDIGTRAGYLRAERDMEGGTVIQGEVENSDIGDNVVLMEGSEVKNSDVENSIILGDCRVEDSILKNTVVGEGTDIEGKDIREGILKRMD